MAVPNERLPSSLLGSTAMYTNQTPIFVLYEGKTLERHTSRTRRKSYSTFMFTSFLDVVFLIIFAFGTRILSTTSRDEQSLCYHPWVPPCSRGTSPSRRPSERNGSCPRNFLGTHAPINDRLVIGWATRSWISFVAPSVLQMLAGTRRTERDIKQKGRGHTHFKLRITGRIGGGVWTNPWLHPQIPYMVSLTPLSLKSDKNQTSRVIPNNHLKTSGKQTAVRSQCDHSPDANAAALHHLYTHITVIYRFWVSLALLVHVVLSVCV